MAYVVIKPLNIRGKRRMIGELLTDSEVSGAAVLRNGYVSKIEDGIPEPGEPAVAEPEEAVRKKSARRKSKGDA